MAIGYKKLFWTEHSKIKMRQYGLSKQKLLGILYKPERKERGIVPGTSAVMKTNKTFFKVSTASRSRIHDKIGTKPISLVKAWQRPRRAPGEIWLMYKDVKGPSVGLGQVRKIISAWRYPGISKPGEAIPVPEDIRNDIMRGIVD